MRQPTHTEPARGMHARTRWVLAGFLAIALFFLLTQHRAHLFGILPYLLLAACPLMHLFHHHGHHGRAASQQSQGPEAPGPAVPDTGSKS
jgi:hypothetical protein